MESLYNLCRKNIAKKVINGEVDLYKDLKKKLPSAIWNEIEELCYVVEEKNSRFSLKTIEHKYLYNGKVHREDDKPSVIRSNFRNLELINKIYTWCQNGRECRHSDLPSKISVSNNGNISSLLWRYHTDKIHPTSIHLHGTSTLYLKWGLSNNSWKIGVDVPSELVFKIKNGSFYLFSAKWSSFRHKKSNLPNYIRYNPRGDAIEYRHSPDRKDSVYSEKFAEDIYKKYSEEYIKYLHYFSSSDE